VGIDPDQHHVTLLVTVDETPRRALLMKSVLASFEPRRDQELDRPTLRSKANSAERQALREPTRRAP
jgi:hypothetical protein